VVVGHQQQGHQKQQGQIATAETPATEGTPAIAGTPARLGTPAIGRRPATIKTSRTEGTRATAEASNIVVASISGDTSNSRDKIIISDVKISAGVPLPPSVNISIAD
jgi:hypothetical protein